MILRPGDEVTRQALETTAVADISTAQELLGKTGRLSRIDLLVPAGDEEVAVLSRIREILPPEAGIVPAGARGSSMEQMTRAFSLNLRALSLLALVVGMFLVYNTMTFSVLQRGQLMGILRALGVTRGELFALVLSEAAVLGAAGTVLGLPLGFFLGEFLLGMVTRSIGDLYFALSVREVSLTAATFLKAAGLGTFGAVAASLGPAYEATSTPPRDVMRRSEGKNRAGSPARRPPARSGFRTTTAHILRFAMSGGTSPATSGDPGGGGSATSSLFFASPWPPILPPGCHGGGRTRCTWPTSP